MKNQTVRCKHRKLPPGDGGIVDGCGWQGPRPSANKCPDCSSPILYEVRSQMDRKTMSRRLEEVIKAADDFMEVADVPVHLRNEKVYDERRRALSTVASLKLSDLLPDEDERLSYTALAHAARNYMNLLADAKVELEGPPRGLLREAAAALEGHIAKALDAESEG